MRLNTSQGRSNSLLDSLIYCDERKAEALAAKIQGIRSADVAFKLQRFTDGARKVVGTDSHSVVEQFFSLHGRSD